jgi:hypothetical protein
VELKSYASDAHIAMAYTVESTGYQKVMDVQGYRESRMTQNANNQLAQWVTTISKRIKHGYHIRKRGNQ